MEYNAVLEETRTSGLSALQSSLRRNGVKYMDLSLFKRIIQSHYFEIPTVLIECLFLAFVQDVHMRISIDNFIGILNEAFSDNKQEARKFIYRVYDVKSNQSIERVNVERILAAAYDSHRDRVQERVEYVHRGDETIEKDAAHEDPKSQREREVLDALFTVASETKVATARTSAARRAVSDDPKYDGLMTDANSQRGNSANAGGPGVVTGVTAVQNKRKTRLRLADFIRFEGDLELLTTWVLRVMGVFYCSPSSTLMRIEKRYSTAVETEEMIARYGGNKANIDRLRSIFHTRCGSSKNELNLDLWVDWVVSYTTVELAAAIFRAKSRSFKLTWRFSDFSEFCMTFGAGSLEDKALALCKMFYSDFVAETQQQLIDTEMEAERLRGADEGRVQVAGEGRDQEKAAKEKLVFFLRRMRVMVLLLARSYDPSLVDMEQPKFSANLSSLSEHVPKSRTRRRSLSHDVGVDVGGVVSNRRPSLLVKDKSDSEKYVMSLEELEESTFLPSSVREVLGEVEQEGKEGNIDPPILLQRYIDLIINQESNLPGLRELSMTSCCLFGVQPPAPHLEKEFVMEIMMRRQAEYPQTSLNPFGPEDTEWCIISKDWWDSWRFYVGKIRPQMSYTSGKVDADFGPQSPERVAAPSPPPIDNLTILKRTGAKQLAAGTTTGRQLEVIPPAVYACVHAWYGGGPRIIRKVVPVIKKSASSEDSSASDEGSSTGRDFASQALTELELFPLNIRVCSCDHHGNKRHDHRDYLFSKTATVAEMTQELSDAKNIEAGKIRLWNYAHTHWKKQYILSPELTLLEARVEDNQEVLMEISSSTGAWPRSQLHADLSEQEMVEEAEAEDKESALFIPSKSGKHSVRVNHGRIGLDNLGNTCYLNSSLQALMHTEPLMNYFLSSYHMKHINVANRDGHGGRLAYYFGKLGSEMWGTTKAALSPRQLQAEVAALNESFAGHQQQDAQELIDFMFSGLSEDLNLVEKKPYCENPDSDGRPDRELANIWWHNHQKRELSIIQALFAGQMKSSRRCSCGYTSSRFEPFTVLQLTIPEDSRRVMTVHVFTLGVSYGTQCTVVVNRRGTLQDVVDAFLHESFDPPLPGLTAAEPHFATAEVSSSKIKVLCKLTRRLSTISDSDNIFFFEVRRESYLDKQVRLQEASRCSRASDESEKSDRVSADIPLRREDSEGYEAKPALHDVKISFVQRKARLGSGGGGHGTFYMTTFGLPHMEVLPNSVSGAELYAVIEQRVAAYRGGRPGQVRRLAMTYGADFEEVFGKASSAYFAGPVRPMSVEEAVGSAIPPNGFVLRLVQGGESSSGCVCSECPWLSQCSGCFIPIDDTLINLRDSQTIAIDWHMVVFEEMVDTTAIMKVYTHPSASLDDDASNSRPGLPFSRCLDKFSEVESLQDCVCPKCLEDDKMTRIDELWRLPPVLVVQLKRFQFDRTAHRKLTNKIDFPVDGLDLNDYIAPSRKDPNYTSPSKQQEADANEKEEEEGPASLTHGEGGEEEARAAAESAGLPLSFSEPDTDAGLGCTVYDLYAAVHHIGAMGSGHYVCTVREGCRPMLGAQNSTLSSSDRDRSGDGASHSTSSESLEAWVDEENGAPGSDRWWIYNDGQVTALTDNKEVSASSAYILFYMRRDVPSSSLSSLYPQSETFKVDRSGDFTPKDRTARRTLSEQATDAAGYMIGGGRRGADGTLPKERKNDCVLS